MAEFYTTDQINAIGGVVGARIRSRTTGAYIVTAIGGEPDANLITDAERTAIATIEPTKFKGSFNALNEIPVAGAGAGDYATLIKAGADTIALFDVGAGAWVDTQNTTSAETAATIKTKYESNANTNAFTDAEKAKLAAMVEASDITSFTAALDAALA